LAYKTSLRKSESIETPLFEYLFNSQASNGEGKWVDEALASA